MSVIWADTDGWILCHSLYLRKIYCNVESKQVCSSCGKYRIFHIDSPFLKRGQKYISSSNDFNENQLFKHRCNTLKNYVDSDSRFYEVNDVRKRFKEFIEKANQNISYFKQCEDEQCDNATATAAANIIFKETENLKERNYQGGNLNDFSIAIKFQKNEYVIPPSCRFFSCNMSELYEKIIRDGFERYDVIVMDPPWRNKYVRRKNASAVNKGYKMMKPVDLLKLPIDHLLSSDGLIAVWCTNSEQIIKSLIEKLFPAWNVCYIGTWYWIKVTEKGEPICKFSSKISEKLPFERLIFGCRVNRCENFKNPDTNKLIISIPSSIHSHKPPLSEMLLEYIPRNGRFLELFARYLLPFWTSVGNEVLKLQLKSLYL